MVKNKKVLFIFNRYRDYSKIISNSLAYIFKDITELQLTAASYSNIIEKIIAYFTKGKYYQKKSYFIQKSFIHNLYEFDFDYIFVLNGFYLNYDVLKILKAKCKKAKFILYLWDDIVRIDGMLDKIQFFDKVYSFDSKDCKRYGFNFLPLFYSPEFANSNFEKKHDLFFCGAIHSRRFNLLKELIAFTNKNNLLLNAKLLIEYRKFIKKYIFDSFFRKNRQYFICKPLGLSDFSKELSSSKVCVDMQANSQTGLTMRCIESLPAQTKIITTNEHIKEYDFYCPENVMIIDRENPVFDVDFIRSPYKPLPKEIVEKYSLENWLKTIFS